MCVPGVVVGLDHLLSRFSIAGSRVIVANSVGNLVFHEVSGEVVADIKIQGTWVFLLSFLSSFCYVLILLSLQMKISIIIIEF